MAAYTIDKIEYDNNVYNLQDNVSGYITGISSSDVTTALGFTPYNSSNPSGYTTNTGTVTKVTAGTGLAIGSTAQGNFTTSGTINHTNSVTAQTTQAIYPIKIDAQGHISAYGTAVTPLTAASTLDATKLSGTIPSSCYTDTNTTYALSNALSSHKFTSTLTAGGSGSGTSTATMEFVAGTGITLTDDTTNKKITIATNLTVPTITLNGSGTTSPSFYAPTTAGTNGYVLKSNGSGAPTWTSAILTDTKNTAGSTDSSSKLFLIGATSQAANPQTYSHDTAYVGTDGCLYSGGHKTLVEIYNGTNENTYLQFYPAVFENASGGDDVGITINAYGKADASSWSGMDLFIGHMHMMVSSPIAEKVLFEIGADQSYSRGDGFVYLTGVSTPTTDTDAANKKYVDDSGFKSTTTSLTTSGWSSNSQSVTVSGITSSSTVIISPAPTSYDTYCEKGVYCSAQGSNSLTFKCDTTPTSALTVNILYK